MPYRDETIFDDVELKLDELTPQQLLELRIYMVEVQEMDRKKLENLVINCLQKQYLYDNKLSKLIGDNRAVMDMASKLLNK